MADQNMYDEIANNRKLVIIFDILFLFVIGCLCYIFRPFMWMFLFSLIFYMALKPLYSFILKKVKKHSLASFITILIFIILIVGPVIFLGTRVVDQSIDFYSYVRNQIGSDDIATFIMRNDFVQSAYQYFGYTDQSFVDKVNSTINENLGKLAGTLTSFVSSSVHTVVDFFFMILVMSFFLKRGDKILASFYKIMPFPNELEATIVARLNGVVKVLVAGNLLIMCLQGLFVGLGFKIFGISNGLLWGCIAVIFSLIPVVGTSIVWLPGALLLFFSGKILPGIGLVVWCIAWYNVFENFLKPILFGKKMDFHPLLFFFLLIGSMQAYGLKGVIVGPLLLTLFYSFLEIYKILHLEYFSSVNVKKKGKDENQMEEEKN